ncbi:hypothetical protein GCM10020358_76940 [Amorphoplanes nipponensis]|uniref:Antitoxin Xre/MbcA/ParS-like toxin-binding domain-containing protein n=1 Tax=Actinoplanes nipponensis TaxID=135950 RepID=A0A919JGB2_9ACTN|nr:hypothetical protein [Actinoplanes nipponensis]GIE49946.1 hypothetical protein Ani05nite_34800 [Actinoplanes nipponensis]
MTATVVERVGHTSVDDDAELCVTALGPELTAYVAGAASVAELKSWMAAPQGPPWQVRRRLAAAAELVTVFENANQSALTAAWLRELDPAGYVPARVLRLSDGDEASVKALLETATSWALTPAAG